MAVTVNSASATFRNCNTGAGSYSDSHTNTAGDVLYVCFYYDNTGSSANDLTNVQYAGVAMTLVRSQNDFDTARRMQLYRLIAPATGANNVSYTTPSDGRHVGIGFVSVAGAHQTTPEVDSDSGQGLKDTTSPNLTLTSTADGMVLDWVAEVANTADIVVGTGQTGHIAINSTNSGRLEGGYEDPSGASTTMTWDISAMSAGARWIHMAVAVQEPGAAVAPKVARLVGGSVLTHGLTA